MHMHYTCSITVSYLTIFLGLLPLGVYGDVVRVKILYNKRDSALIQFKEPQHTQTGEYILLDVLVITREHDMGVYVL